MSVFYLQLATSRSESDTTTLRLCANLLERLCSLSVRLSISNLVLLFLPAADVTIHPWTGSIL